MRTSIAVPRLFRSFICQERKRIHIGGMWMGSLQHVQQGKGINDADYNITETVSIGRKDGKIEKKTRMCPIYHTWSQMFRLCYGKINGNKDHGNHLM